MRGRGSGSGSTGVFGLAKSSNENEQVFGVVGVTLNSGGVGVLADGGTLGVAFEARGPVRFSSAGLATILAPNSSSVTVLSPVPITADSKVVCTLQSPGGILQNVITDPAGNRFTINLTANATVDVTAAWFVIS